MTGPHSEQNQEPSGKCGQPGLFPNLRLPDSRRRFQRKQPEEPAPRKSHELPLFDAVTWREAPRPGLEVPESEAPAQNPVHEPLSVPEPPSSDEVIGASGEVGKAKELLDAIRLLKRIEGEGRGADQDERKILARFGGFGAVALSLFPDPINRAYKSPSWQALGEELQRLLSPEEYASARRTVFNAFYTSPTVVQAMFRRWSGSACPAMPRCLSQGAARATSFGLPLRACGSPASSSIPSPAESPEPFTRSTTFVSRAFAIRSSPRDPLMPWSGIPLCGCEA